MSATPKRAAALAQAAAAAAADSRTARIVAFPDAVRRGSVSARASDAEH